MLIGKNDMGKDYTGEQFEDYKLLRPLGEGGFADVYLAEHRHNRTSAAVKLPKEQQFEDFVNELRRTVLLQHDHIVKIRDFGIRPADKRAFRAYPNNPMESFRKPNIPVIRIGTYYYGLCTPWFTTQEASQRQAGPPR
jgi:serine/threonine protein kinase